MDEYNNIYHRTIKKKPVDFIDNTYIDFKKEVNNKDPNITVGDHVRISKYKNIFAKGCTPNSSEEIFVIIKIKNTVPWTYVINDLNGEEIIGTFYEKELQKTNQQEFRIEKVIKRKGDKLYVKWKGYDNSFNSWIDKKRFSIILSHALKNDLIKWVNIFLNLMNHLAEILTLKLIFQIMQQRGILKNISHVDTSSFALKTNLASLKTEVDKLDIDKLVPVPVDWSKLSDVIKNYVV